MREKKLLPLLLFSTWLSLQPGSAVELEPSNAGAQNAPHVESVVSDQTQANVKSASEIANEQDLILLWDGVIERSPDLMFCKTKLLGDRKTSKDDLDRLFHFPCAQTGTSFSVPQGAMTTGVPGLHPPPRKGQLSQTERIMLGNMITNTAEKLRDVYKQYRQCNTDIIAAKTELKKSHSTFRHHSRAVAAAKEKLIALQQDALAHRQQLIDLAGEDTVSNLDRRLKSSGNLAG